MHTDSIPSSDIVDPTVPDDPRNLEEYTRSQPLPAPAAKETVSTVSTPVFTLGDTMTIEIMHYGLPSTTIPDANYISLGVKVTANGKTAFLAGDINNYDGTETALAARLGHVDLLCLGRHGYYGSNTSGYINTLSPMWLYCPVIHTGLIRRRSQHTGRPVIPGQPGNTGVFHGPVSFHRTGHCSQYGFFAFQ